jgi:hypothetical protein
MLYDFRWDRQARSTPPGVVEDGGDVAQRVDNRRRPVGGVVLGGRDVPEGICDRDPVSSAIVAVLGLKRGGIGGRSPREAGPAAFTRRMRDDRFESFSRKGSKFLSRGVAKTA